MALQFEADFIRPVALETAPDGHCASRYTSTDPERWGSKVRRHPSIDTYRS